MKMLHMIAFMLVVVGAVNWLLVAGTNSDLFQLFAMDMTDTIPRIVYGLVGLSGIYLVINHKKECKVCTAA
jgi:uncharacterized protein